MKKFYILLAILLVGKFSFSQVFFENFQSGSMPSTFTLINDNNTPHANIASLFPTAWSVIDQPGTTDNKVAGSPSWFTAVAPADRWMITPAITLPAGSNLSLTFKSKAQDFDYKDDLKVKISTTGINKTDFTINAYSSVEEDTAFTTKSYSLQSLAGQTIRVAFIQQSTDMFFVFVDDIKVDQSSSVNDIKADNNTISVYPNPAKDFITVNSVATIKTVKVYNTVGQVVVEKSVKDNVTKINVSELKSGVYFVATETEKGIVTKKINVL